GVYLGGLGALTLAGVRTAAAPLDVTAAAGLTVAPDAQLLTGAGTIALTAAAGLTMAQGALLMTGTGTISLAAGGNADGTGSTGGGTLSIGAGATVVSDDAGGDAITLRGSDVDIATGANAALVGAHHIVGGTTPTRTLTGLDGPSALAFDAAGNLYVANYF